MTGWLILGGFIVVVIFAVGIPALRREVRERAEMENQIANLPAFRPELRFDQADAALSLLLDPHSHQFVLAKPREAPRLYSFDQLVAVDVERNGSSLQKTNRGSQMMGAAVGGVLLGPVGLLLGGLTGTKREEVRVKRLSLKLFTNDLQKPVSEVVFFNHPQGVKPDSLVVKTAAQQLDEWHGRFRTILRGNESGPSPQPSSPPTHGEATQPGSFGRRRGLIAQG